MKVSSVRQAIFNPRLIILSIGEIIELIRTNWRLILSLTKREVTERYVGKVFGIFWAIGHPVFLVLVYIFIFGVVFKARIDLKNVPGNYTSYIVSGLLPWMSIIEGMTLTSLVILSNTGLVKQVVFPLETLVFRSVLTAMVPQTIGTCFLLIYILITTGSLPWMVLLLPVLFIIQALFVSGIGFVLAAVGTYFRDVKDFIQLLSIIGIYAMPVVYLPGWVPYPFNELIKFNPFSYVIWPYQDVLFFGRFEHPWAWGVLAIMSALSLIIGYRVFKWLKVYFANVL